MARFVLVFHGSTPQQADIDLIEQSADVTVLDHHVARAMLVDAPEQTARRLREQLKDWTMASEMSYPSPGPARESVRDDDPSHEQP